MGSGRGREPRRTIPSNLGVSTSAGFGVVIVFAVSPLSAAK